MNTTLNRSGRVRSTKKSSDISTQTDHKFNAPQIRINSKVCTDQVKSTCASVSTKCEVSVEVARLAVKTVKKGMYDHDVYLSTEEQSAAEQSTPPDNDQNEPPSKKKRTVPVPSSKADYDKYQYVLPSARTIIENLTMLKGSCIMIPLLGVQLMGSCPQYSIILKLSSGQEYQLRPLFFAYEDREQITNLFIETCKCLSLILNAINNNLSSPVTPAALWHKTDALMTDAVTKYLKIEDNIATALGTTYKPMHLLCKNHTVEALDRSNLSVLYDIEKQIQQREILEGINPSLKSFFRGKKTTVEAGIEALLSLISHDKSGKSSSLSDLFDHIC